MTAAATTASADPQQAVTIGREDFAREALTRKQAALAQLADLQTQRDALAGEEAKLSLAAQRLQAKVETFRTHKETIKTTYTAAKAQTRIGEAVSGISEEMSDVGLAMQRAEDKTAQLQSPAAVIDELFASGALEDATAPGGRDDIQAALDAHAADTSIEAELAGMKGQIAATPDRAAIDAEPPAKAIGGPPAGQEAQPMIIRILGEGQYDVDDRYLDELNALDDRLLVAVQASEVFGQELRALLAAVWRLGAPVPDNVLTPSDLVVPDEAPTHDWIVARAIRPRTTAVMARTTRPRRPRCRSRIKPHEC